MRSEMISTFPLYVVDYHIPLSPVYDVYISLLWFDMSSLPYIWPVFKLSLATDKQVDGTGISALSTPKDARVFTIV
jgi:hypothetical protein